MSDRGNDLAALLCEFLEVAIHTIIYHQEIYPSGIFKKCQKYKALIMMSIYPELLNYITQVLSSIQSFIAKNQIDEVCLDVLDKDGTILLTYVFELDLIINLTELSMNFLYETEAHFRGILLKLSTANSVDTELRKGYTFQIKARCRNETLDEISCNPNMEEFPWMLDKVDRTNPTSKDEVRTLLPIKACHTEKFKNIHPKNHP